MHCLSATAKRGGMRLISTVIGAPDSKTRFAEAGAQFNYGFANYGVKKIVEKDKALEGVYPVALGREKSVAVRTGADFSVFGARNEAGKGIATEVKIGGLRAPIAANSEVGKLCVYKGGNLIAEIPLLANGDVHKKTFGDFFKGLLGEWVNGQDKK
jgi:D-alanyl-D-alanine carboxypeptidase (penicillin-binding protein 5/6)